MTDTDRPVTIDEVWVNRLAARMGTLLAQNERLMVEIESLQAQLQQQQDAEATTNGEFARSD